MKKETKQQMLQIIRSAIESLPKSFWGDASHNETMTKVAMVTTYHVKDVVFDFVRQNNLDGSLFNDLTDKYDLMDFIFRNIRSLNYYEGIPVYSAYDCTGQCCSRSMTIRKFDDYSFVVTLTATFDY